MGLDVPLLLRADPAQGDRQVRLQVQLLDLRRRRPEAPDDAGLQGPRPRPEALPAQRAAELGLRPQERAARRRGGDQGRPQQAGGDVRRGVHALPAAPARGERAGLRRPDHDHGPPLPGVPRGPRDLPAPVPARARRRVPGHQPRAVRPHPPALRRPDGGPDRGRRPARRAGRAGRADGGR